MSLRRYACHCETPGAVFKLPSCYPGENCSICEWRAKCEKRGVLAVAPLTPSIPVSANAEATPLEWPSRAKAAQADGTGSGTGQDFLTLLLLGWGMHQDRQDPPEDGTTATPEPARVRDRENDSRPHRDDENENHGQSCAAVILEANLQPVPVGLSMPYLAANLGVGSTEEEHARGATEGGARRPELGTIGKTERDDGFIAEATAMDARCETGRTENVSSCQSRVAAAAIVPAFEAHIRNALIESTAPPTRDDSANPTAAVNPEDLLNRNKALPQPLNSPGIAGPRDTLPDRGDGARGELAAGGSGHRPASIPEIRSMSGSARRESADSDERGSADQKAAFNDDLSEPLTSPRHAPDSLSTSAVALNPAPGGTWLTDDAREPLKGPAQQPAPVEMADAARPSVAPRDITLQVQNPEGSHVDVKLTNRAGGIHVVVRTQDDGLSRDLRANLPELTERLNRQGMDADAWSPVEMHNTPAGHENSGHAHEHAPGDNPGSDPGRQPGGGGERNHQQPRQRHPADDFNQDLAGFLKGVGTWQSTL